MTRPPMDAEEALERAETLNKILMDALYECRAALGDLVRSGAASLAEESAYDEAKAAITTAEANQ